MVPWGSPMLRNPGYLHSRFQKLEKFGPLSHPKSFPPSPFHRLRVNTSCALRHRAAGEKTILLDAMAEASDLMGGFPNLLSGVCPKVWIEKDVSRIIHWEFCCEHRGRHNSPNLYLDFDGSPSRMPRYIATRWMISQPGE